MNGEAQRYQGLTLLANCNLGEDKQKFEDPTLAPTKLTDIKDRGRAKAM
jgi:hypothetical protein